MKTWEAPEGKHKRSREMAAAILWALHIGGEIDSPGGQATKVLERRMRALGLWHSGTARNFLFIATQLSTDDWGSPVERVVTSSRRCTHLSLNLSADQLPSPPKGWSAKEALEKMEALSEAEVDAPSSREVRSVNEGQWVWPSGTRDDSREMIRAILWTLHDLGGVVASTEGHARKRLFEEVGKRTLLTPNATSRYLLRRLCGEDDGVEYYGRQVLAKTGTDRQCYRIELLVAGSDLPERPEGMEAPARPVKPKTKALARAIAAAQKKEPVTSLIPPTVTNGQIPARGTERTVRATPPPPPIYAGEVEITVDELTATPVVAEANGHGASTPVEEIMDPIDLILAAQRLMTEAVLQIASAGPAVAVDPLVDDSVLRRLNDALEDNQRLRRKVAEASLARDNKAKEVDTVKRVLAEVQANLDAVRGKVAGKQKETVRLMREVPKG